MITASTNHHTHILLAVVLSQLMLIYYSSNNDYLSAKRDCIILDNIKSEIDIHCNNHNSCTDIKFSKGNRLFTILRNKDSNEIIYEVNPDKNGGLNQKNPINIYWIKHNKGSRKETLSMLEKKLAYGINYQKINTETTHFQLVSYPNKTLILKKFENEKFKVLADINGEQAELTKLFIHINGGTFLLPKITSIEIHGINIHDRKNTKEIIRP
jgi:hypothetical protein